MEGKEWEYKPTRENISTIRSTNEFTQNISDKDTLANLTILTRELPCYRTSRADGNSFFRSVAFNYLKDSNLSNFDEVFPDIERTQLDICKMTSIPAEFSKFYKDKTLKQSMRVGWQAIFKSPSSKPKEQRLVLALNKYMWLDFLVINYFRCLIHKTVSDKPDFYKNHAVKSIQSELTRISTYGDQPLLAQVYAFANCICSDIDIYVVSKKGVVRQKYQTDSPKKKQSILLKQAHYDILTTPPVKVEKPGKQKVHFKLDHDSSLLSVNTSQNSKTTINRVPSTRPIIKKGSWGSQGDTSQNSIDQENDMFYGLDSIRGAKIILLFLAMVLAIICVFKSNFYGASSLQTRTDWSWRQDHVIFQMHKIQNSK